MGNRTDQLHPRLHATLERAAALYVQRFPGRKRHTYLSTWRPQLDCSKIRGACSEESKHSLTTADGTPLAEAADVLLPGVSKARDPRGHMRDFAAIVRELDPCVEWGGDYREPDNPHFELQLDRAGCGSPGSTLNPSDRFAAATGLPSWALPAIVASGAVLLIRAL